MRARELTRYCADLGWTDAPDLPPAAHRGESNLPEYLPEVLNSLAALRGEPPELVASYTTTNARRILGLTR